MVLQANRAVFGPPPAEVFDPVPAGDLRRAVVAGIDGLLADLADDTRNVILTLARIWLTVATGEVGSKDAAADWALARLPDEHRAVLARARAIYLGEEDERWDDLASQVRPHADFVVREIERLTADGPRVGRCAATRRSGQATPGRPEGRPGVQSPRERRRRPPPLTPPDPGCGVDRPWEPCPARFDRWLRVRVSPPRAAPPPPRRPSPGCRPAACRGPSRPPSWRC